MHDAKQKSGASIRIEREMIDGESSKLQAHLGDPFVPTQITASVDARIRDRDRRARIGFYAAVVALSVVGIGAYFDDAVLITPLPPLNLWLARMSGVLVGILIWLSIPVRDRRRTGQKIQRMVQLLLLPLFGALIADSCAWRLADFYEFGFSNAKFVSATYPVIGTHAGRRHSSYQIEIDPYFTMEPARISVSRDQFETLRAIPRPACVQVSQRVSVSGAVEVQTNWNGPFRVPHPLRITSCAK